MFKVEGYTITFKRVWYEAGVDSKDMIHRTGRYDTRCEICLSELEVPRCSGIARLHPKDRPDKIIGKKIALRNAIGLLKVEGKNYHRFLTVLQQASFSNKKVRDAIWKAFWAWVASWPNQ